eukprot:tig00001071_g6803.t1
MQPTFGRTSSGSAKRRSKGDDVVASVRLRALEDGRDTSVSNDLRVLQEKLADSFSATVVASEGQVIRYNTQKAFAVYGAIFMARGTVLTFQTVGLSLLCFFTAAALSFFRCPVKQDPDMPWDFCVPVLSFTDCLCFASLVAFLLGTFLNTVFNRWWSIRQLLQVVIGRTNDTALMAASYIVGRTEEEEALAQRIREELVRYLNLAHALVYKQARADESYEDLLDAELITEREADTLKGLVGQPACVYTWAASLLREADARGLIYDGAMMLPTMQQNISLMRGSAADVFMFLDTQIPVYLMAAMTRVHIFLTMLYTTTLLGNAFDSRRALKIVFAFIFQWANVTLYESVLRLGYEMENPLGCDSQDFPVQLYKAKLQRASGHIISLAARLPFASWLPPRVGASGATGSPPNSGRGGARPAPAGASQAMVPLPAAVTLEPRGLETTHLPAASV